MPRPVRIQYAGAVYHVMCRGDRCEAIFADDGDREMFLGTLEQKRLRDRHFVALWNYDADTGWLTSKLDNSGDGPVYTYTNAGRLNARTWDRGKHTVYSYVNGRQVAVKHYTSNTLATADADTPDIGIVYNRIGQPARMVTAATSSLPGTSIEYTFGGLG